MLHHEHLHQLLHQAWLWCRGLLQQSFGAEVLFLPQHGLAGLHRGLLCQLLDQAGNNFFKYFLFSQNGYPAESWQLPISRLVVFHFVSGIHR